MLVILYEIRLTQIELHINVSAIQASVVVSADTSDKLPWKSFICAVQASITQTSGKSVRVEAESESSRHISVDEHGAFV